MQAKTFDNLPLPKYIKGCFKSGNLARIPVYDSYAISNPP